MSAWFYEQPTVKMKARLMIIDYCLILAIGVAVGYWVERMSR